MRPESTPADVERLFLGAVDQALSGDEEAELAARLEADPQLRARLEAYRAAIRRLHEVPRERAPDGLATLILRRSRRRRFHLRRGDEGLAFRVPAEVLIPLLLAALVALFMLLASP